MIIGRIWFSRDIVATMRSDLTWECPLLPAKARSLNIISKAEREDVSVAEGDPGVAVFNRVVAISRATKYQVVKKPPTSGNNFFNGVEVTP